MKDDFQFDEKRHAYFLNGRPILGCTSVLGVIAKPALVPWAAKMTADYASAHIESGRAYNEDELAEIFSEAKVAHRKKKEDAAEKGTDLHAQVEEWVKFCIETNEGVPQLGGMEPSTLRSFQEWAQKQDIRFIATEQRLYSKDLWVAGTCDLIFEKGGKRFIGDIKTYKKIWDRVPLIQCAGYSIMYEEMNGAHTSLSATGSQFIAGYCVICLPKERTFNEVEDVLWSFDPQTEREAFISTVKLYKYLNQ